MNQRQMARIMTFQASYVEAGYAFWFREKFNG
jgi:hypothetical protein